MSEPIGDYVRGELLEQAVNRASELEAELADLRASSVVYKVRCDDCDRGVGTTASGGRYFCHTCGGDGWQLAEGVRKITPAVKVYDKIIGDYVFPARLIEGEK